MWSTRVLVAAVVLAVAACGGKQAAGTAGAEACPARSQTALRAVDVFDGAPESLATLVPDVTGERHGNWQLGYVYDAGRFVTIRCKYADDTSTDVKLDKRIDRCDYTIDQNKTLKVTCK